MTYPFVTYPFGYLYPNEFVEPVVWLPTVFAYSLLISGADLLILAMVSYLLGRLKKAIPMLLIAGISFFATVLLGPLADLRNPDRATLMFAHPHLSPTETNPGVSLIALQGAVLWTTAFLLAAVFTLLYFSYPMYKKYLATRNPLYRVLSLGVSSEARYAAVGKALKALALVAIIPLAFWAVYPATLFVMQTSNFVWNNWTLLPAIYFADVFLTATAIAILLHWAVRWGKPDREVLSPLLSIHGAAAMAVTALLLLQVAIWENKFGGSLFYNSLQPIVEWIYYAVALFLVTFVLSAAASRFTPLSLIVPFTGFAGAVVNKWNIIINAQAVSKTGAGLMPVDVGHLLAEIPLMAAIVAFGVFILAVLSMIFPLELRGYE